MRYNRVCLALILGALASRVFTGEAQPAWKPVAGIAMSRWGQQIPNWVKDHPEMVSGEYPNPCFVRNNNDYQLLHQTWDCAIEAAASSVDKPIPPTAWSGKVLVPFALDSALSGIGKKIGLGERFWYRTSFETRKNWNVPSKWATNGSGRQGLLHFYGVDGDALVLLNGREIGRHQGSGPFVLDVRDTLRDQGAQELLIAVSAGHGEPARGIWQPVCLELVPTQRIEAINVAAEIDGRVRVHVSGTDANEKDVIELAAFDGGYEVARVTGKLGTELALEIKQPKLWSPERPFLYELQVERRRDKSVLDKVSTIFGFRSIKVGASENKPPAIVLNNNSLFMSGIVDAGIWSESGWTLPQAVAARRDIEMMMKLGFNTALKTGKIENDWWYYWADRMGLLVVQEIPDGSAGERAVAELAKHPSVVGWSLPLAGSAADRSGRVRQFKQIDSTRLVFCGGEGDVVQLPDADNAKANLDSGKPGVLAPSGEISDPINVNAAFLIWQQHVNELRKSKGFSGAFFRQFADVAGSSCGLLSADREICRMNVEEVCANAGMDSSPRVKALLPSATSENPAVWQYTESPPQGRWSEPGYDAASWKEGSGGFGNKVAAHAKVRTEVSGKELWLRREFTLGLERMCDPWLVARVAGEAEVFVNGDRRWVARGDGSQCQLMRYGSAPSEMRMHAGKNVLSVHYRPKDGSSLDIGLLDLISPRDIRLPAGVHPVMDIWMRDPTICLGGDGAYYMVATGGTSKPWTSDAIPLFKSNDLKSWESLGMIWSPKKDGWQYKGRDKVGIWAPEIHFFKNTYWLTYCLSYGPSGAAQGTGVLKSTSGKPEGPYEDIKTDGPLTHELDATLFQDDDGTIYFLSGGNTIARMKDDMSGFAEAPRRIEANPGFEGIYMFKVNGKYYLSCAAGPFPECSYDCRVAISDKITGPWRQHHTAVKHGGHNMFFQDKSGKWFTVFFSDSQGPFSEMPAIIPIEFAPDGTIRTPDRVD